MRIPVLRPAIALLLIASSGLLSCRHEASSARGPGKRVAVYADDGAWTLSSESIASALEAEGLVVHLLTARDIRGGALDDVEALVVPGGNAWVQWQALGEAGLEAISEFVAGGRTYLGVCAGAYLATDEVAWEEEGRTDYPLDLLEGVARGALDEIAPWPQVSSTRLNSSEAGRALGLDWSEQEEFFYQGGPAFSDLSGAEVLATYPNGEAAIVSGRFGRGHVSLTAVHFERPAGESNEAPPPERAGERLRALLGL